MRTLIVKLGALGDVVIATALIRRIQQSLVDDELWLLTTPAFAPLFEHWPGLRVQAFPRKGAGNMFRALRWLRSMRFDRLFDLQSNDRSSLLVALSGVPERIGNLPRFPYTRHPPDWYRSETHIFERMNEVLVSAGLPPAEPRPWLPASDADRQRVDDWLAAQGLAERPLALLHAGASPRWPSKCWPYYAELGERLAQAGLGVVWVGAGEDAGLNATLAKRAGVDATDAFSIVQLAELGRRARFAVTNDSGPMHILSAAGIPLFAFFGPTRWVKNHALGQAERVLRHPVECSPCQRGTCPPERGHACLAGIGVDEVLARLEAEGLLAPANP
ncbi:glycosyltransferase family 9 protein [Thiohalobacter sp. IOR34]|uniref:glycosyltransferase family 9 protein n=1 Tax=Thiohalobacter sp. IOR34 TaxID=3057176 RepID=UPI0025B08237|nr:glycosyltransferase family 9 protein [Thiohalobacter sp. IOR34]WJW75270.1 glycosyltransferase family 9 protein [Thiohalobacter sp. IOR34]